MNKPTPIGSRVRVPHGIGTVTLYELLLRDTITYSDHVPHDVDYRLMVVLDPDHTWSFQDKLYAAWEKEVITLNTHMETKHVYSFESAVS